MQGGYQRVIDELETQGLLVSSYFGENQMAHCPGPSHSGGDQRPSLSVKEGDDGRALLYCHAGCTLIEVVNALGLSMSDLFGDETDDNRIVAEYVYTDAEGSPLYRVNRTTNKDFFQDRWTADGWKPGLKNTERVLYNLPSVLDAIKNDVPVYRVEGEKDVHTTMACETGIVATTNSGGAKAWRPEYSELLQQAHELYIVADMDKTGIEWAKLIASQTGGIVRYPPVGKDATDALLKGYHLVDFLFEEPFDEDWDDWQSADHAEILWLFDDVFAAGTLVWCYGPKETAKSFYLLSVASALSHRGYKSTFYSEEMPYNLDVDRIQRFGPDPEYFHWKNGRGLDLTQEENVDRVIQENQGSAFIIFDSYERVWGGRANENRRAAEFAAVCKHIIVETNATVAVIDHTGYPEKDESGKAHSPRRARGASAKEQQADMSILFESRGDWRGKGHDYFFRITNMKPGRLGNVFMRDLILRDTADGGIAVVTPDAPRTILGLEGAENPSSPAGVADGSEEVETTEASMTTTEHAPSTTFKEQRANRRLERAHRLARIPKTGSKEQQAKLEAKHAEPKKPKDERLMVPLDDLLEQM